MNTRISKKNVFDANLGFGYDNGSWLGRGALKILPAGFGLDIFLGGLSDRGAMIGLSIDLPAPTLRAARASSGTTWLPRQVGDPNFTDCPSLSTVPWW